MVGSRYCLSDLHACLGDAHSILNLVSGGSKRFDREFFIYIYIYISLSDSELRMGLYFLVLWVVIQPVYYLVMIDLV